MIKRFNIGDNFCLYMNAGNSGRFISLVKLRKQTGDTQPYFPQIRFLRITTMIIIPSSSPWFRLKLVANRLTNGAFCLSHNNPKQHDALTNMFCQCAWAQYTGRKSSFLYPWLSSIYRPLYSPTKGTLSQF